MCASDVRPRVRSAARKRHDVLQRRSLRMVLRYVDQRLGSANPADEVIPLEDLCRRERLRFHAGPGSSTSLNVWPHTLRMPLRPASRLPTVLAITAVGFIDQAAVLTRHRDLRLSGSLSMGTSPSLKAAVILSARVAGPRATWSRAVLRRWASRTSLEGPATLSADRTPLAHSAPPAKRRSRSPKEPILASSRGVPGTRSPTIM